MGKIVEGLWDCKYCKSKGIGGSKRECPHCGKPRDTDTKFYMPGTITYVEEGEANEVSRNPDWVCRFCDCLNPDKVDVCISCGASRTAENLDYFENQNKKEQESKSSSVITEEPRADPNDSHEEMKDANVPENNIVSPMDNSEENKQYSLFDKCKNFAGNAASVVGDFLFDSGPVLLVIALVALIIGGIIFLAVPRTRTVTVDHTYWEQTIEIERYQTVDESGWSLPQNARLHESRREIYEYEQVLDHYEDKTRQLAKQRVDHYEERVVGYKDLGNGYFEEQTERVPVYETYYETEHYQEPVYRSEPVYKTKYYYEIDKWLYDRALTTSGIDSEPYWADTSKLKSDERTSTQKGNYTFRGTDEKGDSKEYTAKYSDWSDLNAGDEITIKVSVFGNVKSIEYPEKEE